MERPSHHKLPETDAFAAELGYFADCAIHGRKPERCLPEESAQAVALMHRILGIQKAKGGPGQMQDLKTQNLKELEIAVLFWAGGDPEKRWRR